MHTGALVAWWSDLALYLAIPAAVLVGFGIVVAFAFGAGGTSVVPSYRELARNTDTNRLPAPAVEDDPQERKDARDLAPAHAPEFQVVFDRISELNTAIQAYNLELLNLASPGNAEQGPAADSRQRIQHLHSLRDAAIGELVSVMGATLYHQAVQIGAPRSASAVRHQDLCHA
ncbi:MAG: hypothetical protein JNK85_13475 [Verrucomicrobiales bacterium]|nr:hypothetical protein [Verrucomicrobiales bacterium]